jgi:hypothetical protein
MSARVNPVTKHDSRASNLPLPLTALRQYAHGDLVESTYRKKTHPHGIESRGGEGNTRLL